MAKHIPCGDLFAYMGDGAYATYGATWTFASHAHTRITTSTLTLDAHPADVAAWITDQARQAASPAYIAWETRRRFETPRLNRADRADLSGTPPPAAIGPAGSRSTGPDIKPF